MVITQSDLSALRSWSRDEESMHNIVKFLSDTTSHQGFLLFHIDDDLVYLDALGHYLSAGGFRVISLTEPATVLPLIPLLKPALIIIDYYMPEMDGPALYAAISQIPEAKGLPIVFLTSAADERIAQSRSETGALFLSKQQPPELLVGQFSDLIGANRP